MFIKDHIHYTLREDLSVFIPHVFESLFIEFGTLKKQFRESFVDQAQPQRLILIYFQIYYVI